MQVLATIPVNAASRVYDVVVGHGVLADVGPIVRRLLPKSGRAFLVHDTGVPATVWRQAAEGLRQAGFAVTDQAVTPSEKAKSLATLESVLAAIAVTRHERSDPVIALGGGIVGDLAGFAAASYRRGVPIIQCPSTLLAMVDASVGGKTGVNLGVGADGLLKNMVGAFHQPHVVVADVAVLSTLADRQFRCGLAECVKHAMLSGPFGDPGLLDWTEQRAGQILRREPTVLVELVARNIRVKAAVVAGDEREEAEPTAGGRALLNLGHTFGHAIETLLGLHLPGATEAGIEHGEAVALGLVAATTAAEVLTPALSGIASRIRKPLDAFGLPTAVEGLPDPETLIARMGHDKKAAAGVIRLILPDANASCRVCERPERRAVEAGLAAIRRASV